MWRLANGVPARPWHQGERDMNQPLLFLIFVLGALAAELAIAGSQDSVPSGSVAATETKSWTSTLAGRQKQAEDWRNGFARLESQIPTLSPAEQGWLQTEVSNEIANAGGRYTARALAAMRSREYQISVARSSLPGILAILGVLADPKPLSMCREIELWTEYAAETTDPRFWDAMSELVRLNTVDAKINGVESFYFEDHVMWAHMILSDIVVPSLGGCLE